MLPKTQEKVLRINRAYYRKSILIRQNKLTQMTIEEHVEK